MMKIGAKNRVAAALLTLALLLSMLAGCTASAATAELTEDVSPQSVDTTGALTEDAIASINAFAAELFRDSAAAGEENTLVSPVSVFLALAMAANGADGETLAAFEEVLGGYGLTLAQLNAAGKALIDGLTETDGSTTINIANSVWYDKDFTPDSAFLQADADYYGAEAFLSDFAKSETVDEVNAWVEEKTNGLITDILDGIDPQAIMLLFNTLYLKATWMSQFSQDNNSDGDFYLADGGTARATYMHSGPRQETYLSKDGASGILLPYDDGKLAYLAVLPPEGTTAADYAASFDETTIAGLLDSGTQTSVQLTLPKYTAEYKIALNDVLGGMGLSIAFDPENADFSKMGSADGNIFINRVLHNTVIKVNETGTEAAAATGIEMGTTAMPVDFITLTFDRPFVYAVVDLSTGIPLFTGVLDNPG